MHLTNTKQQNESEYLNKLFTTIIFGIIRQTKKLSENKMAFLGYNDWQLNWRIR